MSSDKRTDLHREMHEMLSATAEGRETLKTKGSATLCLRSDGIFILTGVTGKFLELPRVAGDAMVEQAAHRLMLENEFHISCNHRGIFKVVSNSLTQIIGGFPTIADALHAFVLWKIGRPSVQVWLKGRVQDPHMPVGSEKNPAQSIEQAAALLVEHFDFKGELKLSSH